MGLKMQIILKIMNHLEGMDKMQLYKPFFVEIQQKLY